MLHLSDKMMETMISLTNMVNKTFNEMDTLEHQIKKIGSDIENLKQKVPEQGNKLYIPCDLLIMEQPETHQKLLETQWAIADDFVGKIKQIIGIGLFVGNPPLQASSRFALGLLLLHH